MSDPIQKHFGYGQLWPLRPACNQNRAGSYLPDVFASDSVSFFFFFFLLFFFFFLLLFLFFFKEGMHHIVRTDLYPVWMAWSVFGETDMVWKQAGTVCSFWPARDQFSTFRLGCNHPQTARIIPCKTSPDLI